MFESVDDAIAKAIERARAQQRSDGDWFGHWRVSALQFHYGLALLDGGCSESDTIIQDLCDAFEHDARTDGGFSFTPEAPSSIAMTIGWVAFLKRCRPRSAAIAPAEAFLARSPGLPSLPGGLIARWLVDESSRGRVARFSPPPKLVRRLGWRVASRFLVPPTRAPDPPSARAERIGARAAQALAWPLPDDLARDLPRLSLPFAIPMYTSLLALQLLAEPRSRLAEGRDETRRIIEPWLDEFRYDDGSIYYLNAILPFLVCLKQLGRDADLRSVRGAVENISYQRGGWLGTAMAGMNIFDTALTLQGLHACGVPSDDPVMNAGVAFLNRAKPPDRPWSWAWAAAQGPRQRLADTDDSGAAILALRLAGGTLTRKDAAIASFLRLQKPEGGFVVFDMPSAIYNPVTPSNTARALRALHALGVGIDHEAIRRGCEWLRRSQRPDGSWFDFWFNDPVYGTAMALEALVELGALERGDPDVERGMNRILRDQNGDRGWGYDFYGRRVSRSVVEHTSWAVHALCTLTRPSALPLAPLGAAVRFLVGKQLPNGDWPATGIAQWNGRESYTDAQFPVAFALRALGAYRQAVAMHLPRTPHLVRALRLVAKKGGTR